MQGANRECRCGRSGKYELPAEDEVLPQRNNEEDTEVTTCKGQRQKLAKVTRRGTEQAQLVHSGNRGYLFQFDSSINVRTAGEQRRKQTYEKKPKTTRRCRGGLSGTILLGAEVSTKHLSENTGGG